MLKLQETSFLVVDDAPVMRRLISGMLWAFGAREVRDAADGADAYDCFRRAPCDAVITDLAMAPTDGLALVQALRTDPASPNPFVPILMVSSHAEPERRKAARDAGIDDYMLKPVVPGVLYACLMAVLNDRRPMIDGPTYRGPDRRSDEDDAAYGGPERRV